MTGIAQQKFHNDEISSSSKAAALKAGAFAGWPACSPEISQFDESNHERAIEFLEMICEVLETQTGN